MPPRLRGLLLVSALTLGAGALWLVLRGRGAVALDCPPAQVHLDAHGVAHCGPGAPLPASQALTLGQKADLNAIGADELARLPGVGESLAEAIVKRRSELGRFETFEQVDAVPGVGPAKLEALKQMVEIR